MAELPFLPFYVADYRLDTPHLTLEQHGAYVMLLSLCWTTPGCSIPADPSWIMGRLRIDAEAYERAVAPVVAEFFRRARGRIYSRRLRAEFESALATHQLRSSAGEKGGRSRKSLNGNDPDPSRAKAGPKQPQPQPEPQPDSHNGGGGGSRGAGASDPREGGRPSAEVVPLRPPSFRDRLVVAAGGDPARRGRLGNDEDMRLAATWIAAGFTEDECVAIVADEPRKGRVSSLAYYGNAFGRALARRQAPPDPLQPTESSPTPRRQDQGQRQDRPPRETVDTRALARAALERIQRGER